MMQNRFHKIMLLLGIILLSHASVYSQTGYHKAIPDIPSPPRLVNDFAGILSSDEVSQLEAKLLNFAHQSSNEMTIVTIDNLDGMDISDFAVELGRKWDIGKEKKKNGVLLLASMSEHKVNISPGDGLSGVLPDIICGRIIRNYIVPDFKAGNYYLGFDKAITAIIAASKGEFTNDEPEKKIGRKIFSILKFFGILLILFFYFYMRRNSNNLYVSRRGYKYNDNRWGGTGGGFFGGSSWGGSGGSSSSGGFGGFGGGGGGFSGGGASGSW